MTAQQHNAHDHDPNNLGLTRVAVYERTVRAGIEQVWENVLDWEHLAHLHSSSFDVIDLIDAGDRGWRVYSDARHTSTVELVIADDHSYVSRSYNDGAQNAEIWTHLSPGETSTDIRVEFYAPDAPEGKRDAIGRRMLDLYTCLWDEDEAMMMERARRLRESRSHARTVALGRAGDLQLPVTFQLGGREYRLCDVAGELTVLPAVCPHLLGPLPECPAADGTLTCPWHGYRFDLETGACLYPPAAPCRLPPMPSIQVEDGRIILSG